jgi:hypothetical protein
VLTQLNDDGEHVISYFSRKLTVREKKFTTTEKECLSVLESVEKFRCYIEGVKFTVVTDHSALVWLLNLKDPPGRLARWVMRLQDFKITFRPGKLNHVPDALSRAIELIEILPDKVSDPQYSELINRVNGDPAKFSDFKTSNGVLHKFISTDNPEDPNFQ